MCFNFAEAILVLSVSDWGSFVVRGTACFVAFL
jgi:hypothetical protein